MCAATSSANSLRVRFLRLSTGGCTWFCSFTEGLEACSRNWTISCTGVGSMSICKKITCGHLVIISIKMFHWTVTVQWNSTLFILFSNSLIFTFKNHLFSYLHTEHTQICMCEYKNQRQQDKFAHFQEKIAVYIVTEDYTKGGNCWFKHDKM